MNNTRNYDFTKVEHNTEGNFFANGVELGDLTVSLIQPLIDDVSLGLKLLTGVDFNLQDFSLNGSGLKLRFMVVNHQGQSINFEKLMRILSDSLELDYTPTYVIKGKALELTFYGQAHKSYNPQEQIESQKNAVAGPKDIRTSAVIGIDDDGEQALVNFDGQGLDVVSYNKKRRDQFVATLIASLSAYNTPDDLKIIYFDDGSAYNDVLKKNPFVEFHEVKDAPEVFQALKEHATEIHDVIAKIDHQVNHEVKTLRQAEEVTDNHQQRVVVVMDNDLLFNARKALVERKHYTTSHPRPVRRQPRPLAENEELLEDNNLAETAAKSSENRRALALMQQNFRDVLESVHEGGIGFAVTSSGPKKALQDQPFASTTLSLGYNSDTDSEALSKELFGKLKAYDYEINSGLDGYANGILPGTRRRRGKAVHLLTSNLNEKQLKQLNEQLNEKY